MGNVFVLGDSPLGFHEFRFSIFLGKLNPKILCGGVTLGKFLFDTIDRGGTAQW